MRWLSWWKLRHNPPGGHRRAIEQPAGQQFGLGDHERRRIAGPCAPQYRPPELAQVVRCHPEQVTEPGSPAVHPSARQSSVGGATLLGRPCKGMATRATTTSVRLRSAAESTKSIWLWRIR
jgi:hypothetical protein